MCWIGVDPPFVNARANGMPAAPPLALLPQEGKAIAAASVTARVTTCFQTIAFTSEKVGRAKSRGLLSLQGREEAVDVLPGVRIEANHRIDFVRAMNRRGALRIGLVKAQRFAGRIRVETDGAIAGLIVDRLLARCSPAAGAAAEAESGPRETGMR